MINKLLWPKEKWRLRNGVNSEKSQLFASCKYISNAASQADVGGFSTECKALLVIINKPSQLQRSNGQPATNPDVCSLPRWHNISEIHTIRQPWKANSHGVLHSCLFAYENYLHNSSLRSDGLHWKTWFWGRLLVAGHRAKYLLLHRSLENSSSGRREVDGGQFGIAEAPLLICAKSIERWCARCYCPLGSKWEIIISSTETADGFRSFSTKEHSFQPATRKLIRSNHSHGFLSTPY